jgi:(2R)-sulfolactate sulfo-lyase subunit beta
MDTSSAAAAAVALWATSGAVVHLFPTGQGNIIGNPIVSVIKLSANPLTIETMSEHIDLNVSAILKGESTLDEAGHQLIDMVRRVFNGRFKATEALGQSEFVFAKRYIIA